MPVQVLKCFRALNASLWENPLLMVGPGHRKVTASCFWKTESSSANSSCCLPEGPKCVFQATAVPVSTSELEVQLEQWITQWDYPSASVRPWASCRNKAPSVCKCQKVWKIRYKRICTTKFVLDFWREHLIRAACSITPAQMHFFSFTSWKKGLSSFIRKHWLHGTSWAGLAPTTMQESSSAPAPTDPSIQAVSSTQAVRAWESELSKARAWTASKCHPSTWQALLRSILPLSVGF